MLVQPKKKGLYKKLSQKLTENEIVQFTMDVFLFLCFSGNGIYTQHDQGRAFVTRIRVTACVMAT